MIRIFNNPDKVKLNTGITTTFDYRGRTCIVNVQSKKFNQNPIFNYPSHAAKISTLR